MEAIFDSEKRYFDNRAAPISPSLPQGYGYHCYRALALRKKKFRSIRKVKQSLDGWAAWRFAGLGGKKGKRAKTSLFSPLTEVTVDKRKNDLMRMIYIYRGPEGRDISIIGISLS